MGTPRKGERGPIFHTQVLGQSSGENPEHLCELGDEDDKFKFICVADTVSWHWWVGPS